MTIQQEFDKALKKFEEDFANGTVSKDQFDKLEVWQQLLQAKSEAPDSKPLTGSNSP